MNLPPAVSVPLYFAGFVCLWCFVGWLTARVGGWYALAKRFPAGPKKPDGVRMYYLESLELDMGQYKGCAVFGVAPAGLYMSVLLPFRVGHPPLLIPWNAITKIKNEKQLWMNAYELSVPLENGIATITFFNNALAAAVTPHLTPAATTPYVKITG